MKHTNFTKWHLWHQFWTVLEAQDPLPDHICRLHDHSDDPLNLTWLVNLSELFGWRKHLSWSPQGHPRTVQSTGCNKTKAILFSFLFLFSNAFVNVYVLGQTPYQGQHMKCISRTPGSSEWHHMWILLRRYTITSRLEILSLQQGTTCHICLEKKMMTSSNLLPARQGRPQSGSVSSDCNPSGNIRFSRDVKLLKPVTEIYLGRSRFQVLAMLKAMQGFRLQAANNFKIGAEYYFFRHSFYLEVTSFLSSNSKNHLQEQKGQLSAVSAKLNLTEIWEGLKRYKKWLN